MARHTVPRSSRRSRVARMAFPLHTLLVIVVTVVLFAGTTALGADRDGDLLRDGFETRWGVTDSDKSDSDGDGVVDSAEDNDGDRLSNLGEQRFGTNPGKRDTDRDGTNDGSEDSDRDGISDAREQDQRPLPAGLEPSLADASKDYPAAREDCFSLPGDATLRPCIFGDEASATTIAVFGDSHSLMWLPAISRAATQEGWRVVTLLKGSCPSVSVGTRAQARIDGNRSCRAWRRSAFTWLDENPPDLVLLSNSSGYPIVAKGRTLSKSKAPSRWASGLRNSLGRLPASSVVLVLGDVLANRLDPTECLSRHRDDISSCVARRVPPRKRTFELIERRVAAAAGAEFRTLYYKICTYDPCPLVQGNVLIWRGYGHITATIARRLAPSMRTLLRGVVR